MAWTKVPKMTAISVIPTKLNGNPPVQPRKTDRNEFALTRLFSNSEMLAATASRVARWRYDPSWIAMPSAPRLSERP
jgi:hypothetical protein